MGSGNLKDRQCNGKKTNGHTMICKNTTQKTNDWVTRTLQKNWGELAYTEKVSSSCSTSCSDLLVLRRVCRTSREWKSYWASIFL